MNCSPAEVDRWIDRNRERKREVDETGAVKLDERFRFSTFSTGCACDLPRIANSLAVTRKVIHQNLSCVTREFPADDVDLSAIELVIS